jgi:hypothetical protein
VEFLRFARLQWDRVGAVLALVVGFVVLLLGYAGTSDTEFVAEQVPYLISGGLMGLFFVAIAAVLWISADQRDEWRELRNLADAVRQEQLARQEAASVPWSRTGADQPIAQTDDRLG